MTCSAATATRLPSSRGITRLVRGSRGNDNSHSLAYCPPLVIWQSQFCVEGLGTLYCNCDSLAVVLIQPTSRNLAHVTQQSHATRAHAIPPSIVLERKRVFARK